MIVALEREWYEKCYLWVLDTTFSYKDYNKGIKEKVFDSNEKAEVEAEKFISRRLRTGSWKVLSETREDFYLRKLQGLEADVKEQSELPGYDDIKGYLLRFHSAKFSELESLANTLGVTLEKIPMDYQNFLLTVNGFSVTYSVEKNKWGNQFEMSLLGTIGQAWFQEHKSEFASLRTLNEPFIVVSIFNRSHEKKSLSGAVLVLSSGAVFKYDEDIKVGEFKDFGSYFEFELLEFKQRCNDARHWVDRQAG
jgi:hypothetical protein